MKQRDCTIYVAKTKALISCAADLGLCFRIRKIRLFHDAAQLSVVIFMNYGKENADISIQIIT